MSALGGLGAEVFRTVGPAGLRSVSRGFDRLVDQGRFNRDLEERRKQRKQARDQQKKAEKKAKQKQLVGIGVGVAAGAATAGTLAAFAAPAAAATAAVPAAVPAAVAPAVAAPVTTAAAPLALETVAPAVAPELAATGALTNAAAAPISFGEPLALAAVPSAAPALPAGVSAAPALTKAAAGAATPVLSGSAAPGLVAPIAVGGVVGGGVSKGAESFSRSPAVPKLDAGGAGRFTTGNATVAPAPTAPFSPPASTANPTASPTASPPINPSAPPDARLASKFSTPPPKPQTFAQRNPILAATIEGALVGGLSNVPGGAVPASILLNNSPRLNPRLARENRLDAARIPLIDAQAEAARARTGASGTRSKLDQAQLQGELLDQRFQTDMQPLKEGRGRSQIEADRQRAGRDNAAADLSRARTANVGLSGDLTPDQFEELVATQEGLLDSIVTGNGTPQDVDASIDEFFRVNNSGLTQQQGVDARFRFKDRYKYLPKGRKPPPRF